jgi:hypothetical protein
MCGLQLQGSPSFFTKGTSKAKCRNKHSQVNGLGAADDFWYSSMRKLPQAHSPERQPANQPTSQLATYKRISDRNMTQVSQLQPFPR